MVLGGVAAVGMFLVLVMGATVTNTGSAEGCGRDWPLCQGHFIPAFALATAIEFSHRAVTGIEGILIVVLAIAMLARWRDRKPARVLVALMIGFLLLQAGMGAWAVKYPQQPVVLALHFGISLLALASTSLAALYIRRPAAMAGVRAAGTGVRLATWGAAGYIYLLVYSGAYIRRAEAAAACSSWPLCGGGSPGPGAAVVDLIHRFAAAAALLLAIGLLLGYRRLAAGRPDLARGAWLLIGSLVLQGAVGAYLVFSRFSLGSELVHAGVTGIVFTTVAYLCLRVTLGTRASAPTRAPVPGRLRPEGAP